MSYSPERYKQVTRALKVLEFLQNSRFGKTLRELRDDVVDYIGLASCSLKSIERDLKFLQGLGFNIEPYPTDDPERSTVWRLDKSYVNLPKLQVSVAELLAFAAGRDLLFPLAGTPYWEGVQTLWSKMRENLPPAVWELFERLRPGLIVRGGVPEDYSQKEGMLSALNRAIYEHRVTAIDYQGLDDGAAQTREIEPYAIVLFSAKIYVIAVDAGVRAGDFKLFKLDRLQRVTVLDKRFKARADLDPERLFASSIGIFRSNEPKSFRIRIAGRCARWAVETPFHPRQQVVPGPNGDVVLEIPAAYEQEIIPRVLSLGDQAEVLEPDSCRTALGQIAKTLAQTYA